MPSYDLTIPTGSQFTKRFLIKKSDGTILDLSGYSATMQIIQTPGEFYSVSFSSTGGQITMGGATGILTLSLTPAEIATMKGNFYKIEVTDAALIETQVLTGNLFLLDETKVGVDYLIPMVRLRIGDTNALSYRYLDEWVKTSLITGIKSLENWWRGRYTVTNEGIVSRTTDTLYTFGTALSEGVIEQKDEYVIVLMAAYLLLSGSLENSAYSTQSWRDNEISFSNLESGRMRDSNLKRLWDEIMNFLTPPSKRLARARKGDLWGYKGNIFERTGKF